MKEVETSSPIYLATIGLTCAHFNYKSSKLLHDIYNESSLQYDSQYTCLYNFMPQISNIHNELHESNVILNHDLKC